MKRDEAVWLIKSGGRILGPYNQDDIERLLRSKELHVIDEICEPARRWQLIRDHQAYREMLEKLRNEDVSIDEGTTTSGGVTGSMTESLHGSSTDDITEDISEFQNQLKEIVYDNIADNQRAPRAGAQGRFQAAGQVDERMIRQEAEKGSRWMWGLTILVLLLVGGFWGAKRVNWSSLKAGGRVDPVVMGLNLFADGDYAAALEILKKAYNNDPSRKDIWYPLATMLVQIEGQTVEAKRLLQKVIDERTDEPAAAWTAMALAQMTDGDSQGANESLSKALAKDANFLPAKANKGMLALSKKDYPTARQMLSQVYNGGLKRGEVLLQLVVAQIHIGKNSNDREAMAATSKTLQAYLRERADYQQELRLTEVYLNFVRNEISAADLERHLRRVIDVDPQQTDDFRHPILVAKPTADWSHTAAWCRELSEAGAEIPSGIALGAVCLFKQGQHLQAKAAIEKAINQAPRDALLQAVYAAILRAAGFGGEASVALGRAIELDRRNEYLLPVLLQARFCLERDDLECANNFWMKVLQVEPKLPSAKVGLAEVYWQRQSKSEAQKLMQEISSVAADYRPYLRLKRQMETKSAL
ncbi:MAG: tetratricopeptide repeat protein [Bdellovibrionales bacterium]